MTNVSNAQATDVTYSAYQQRAVLLGSRIAERFSALHESTTLEEAKRHGLVLHALANQAAGLASEVTGVGVQPLSGGINKT